MKKKDSFNTREDILDKIVFMVEAQWLKILRTERERERESIVNFCSRATHYKEEALAFVVGYFRRDTVALTIIIIYVPEIKAVTRILRNLRAVFAKARRFRPLLWRDFSIVSTQKKPDCPHSDKDRWEGLLSFTRAGFLILGTTLINCKRWHRRYRAISSQKIWKDCLKRS